MKKKIVISYIHYPLAIGKYFEFALRRRDDVEVFSVGPYTGNWIPWNNGMNLPPSKHIKAPDFALPREAIRFSKMPSAIAENSLPWEPDLWLQIDAGFYFAPRPKARVVAHVATDPHVLNYDVQRMYSDFFFNMQTPYMQKDDIYLPYAFDPFIHRPLDVDHDFDAILLGLHYKERNEWVAALRNRGYRVLYDIGKVYDEYNELNNKARVGLNWSSKQDLVARVWELAGAAVPIVTNYVPDMHQFFDDGEHYLGFNTLDEAVFQVTRLMSDEDLRERIRWSAHRLVKDGHTWDDRVHRILKVCEIL